MSSTSRDPGRLSLMLAAIGTVGCAHSADVRYARCAQVLRAQAAAWNRGDLEGFARGYAESPHTVFASTSGVSVGHRQMLERYRRRYADREAMGELSFSELRFESLDEKTVIVLGRWQLQRARDAPQGRFVLLMRPQRGQWRIVVDYTTADGS
jgi:hypothetical protein